MLTIEELRKKSSYPNLPNATAKEVLSLYSDEYQNTLRKLALLRDFILLHCKEKNLICIQKDQATELELSDLWHSDYLGTNYTGANEEKLLQEYCSLSEKLGVYPNCNPIEFQAKSHGSYHYEKIHCESVILNTKPLHSRL